MEKKAQEYVKSCNANLGNLGIYAGNIAKSVGQHLNELIVFTAEAILILHCSFGGALQPNVAAPVVLKAWWSKGQQVGLPSDNVYNDRALYTFGNVSSS